MTTKTDSIGSSCSTCYDDIDAKEAIDFINSQSKKPLNIIPHRDVRPQDVLPAKNLKTMWNPGNVRLDSLISENFEKYQTATDGEKTKIEKSFVDTIRREGGRLLKVHTQGDRLGVNHSSEMLWKEVRGKSARKMVSTRFWIERRRRLRKRSEEIRDEVSCVLGIEA